MAIQLIELNFSEPDIKDMKYVDVPVSDIYRCRCGNCGVCKSVHNVCSLAMLARGAGRRRSTRLYTEAVDSALTAHLPFIKALFRGHSGRNQTREDVKKMCSLGEWMDLMAKARPRKQRARATRMGACLGSRALAGWVLTP